MSIERKEIFKWYKRYRLRDNHHHKYSNVKSDLQNLDETYSRYGYIASLLFLSLKKTRHKQI